MLIILTFIVGYFVSKTTVPTTSGLLAKEAGVLEEVVSKPLPTVPNEKDLPANVIIPSQGIQISYSSYGDVQSSGELEALISVLTHHDVSVTFHYGIAAEDLEKGISRFLVLQTYFIRRGVPAAAVRADIQIKTASKEIITYSLSNV